MKSLAHKNLELFFGAVAIEPSMDLWIWNLIWTSLVTW